MDSLLLTATRVHTFSQHAIVTSRHVLIDEPSGHYPDRIDIELHIEPTNLGSSTCFSVPLYVDQRAVWRQGCDAGGAIDVAVVELQESALPDTMAYRTFTHAHLPDLDEAVEIDG